MYPTTRVGKFIGKLVPIKGTRFEFTDAKMIKRGESQSYRTKPTKPDKTLYGIWELYFASERDSMGLKMILKSPYYGV
jgi:hypothetical protein